jgi:hypothetical protein
MGLHERLQRIEAEHAGRAQVEAPRCGASSNPTKSSRYGPNDVYRCTKPNGHRPDDPQHEDDYGSKWLDSPTRILIWKGPKR